MQYRRHYRCVGEKGLDKEIAAKVWDQITANEIVKYIDKEE
jgi:RNA-binding protein YhbY